MKNTQSNDDSYFISMTDIMVGLLLIFILILMFFAIRLKEDIERGKTYVEDAEKHRSTILEELREFLKGRGILNVEIDETHGILRLPEGVLFATGQVDIHLGTDADFVARTLSRAFHSVLACSVFSPDGLPLRNIQICKNQNNKSIFVESVFIEGHTDNVPVRETGLKGYPSLTSNLRLSALRATNTYEIMVNETRQLADYSSPEGRPIFASTAYGETRPVGNNTIPEGRRLNRRIDIRILMYIPEEKEEFNKRLFNGYEINRKI